MATINTAIRLNDMMSKPIRHIISAMDGMLSTWNELESSTRRGLNVKGVETVRANLALATKSLDDMEREQREFNRQVHEGSNAMDGLTGKIMGAVGAYVGMQGLQKLVNLSDSFVQTQARLDMINDGLQTTEELFDKITASANRSRASISTTADTVAKLSLNAGDAFGSNDETILFAENLNKLFAIAGTEQASIASASLQLTQALGSGVLRGEELNAVFEAAPNIMQTVADYMDVPIGKLRGMAADGQITADIVKNALLSATDEINAQFESMPMTWAQVWTQILNGLYYASQPLLQMISWMAQNWSVLAPIILGVAAALAVYWAATSGVTMATKAWAAAQAFLNGVMALNPVFLIIMGIILLISLIYAAVAAYNKATDSAISATGLIVGVITGAISVVWNLFVTLLSLIIQSVLVPLTQAWDNFANFFGNIFTDPIATIIRMFEGLANSVLGILKTIAQGIDAIFGSNLAGTVQGWMNGVSGKADALVAKYGNGTYEEKSNLTGQLQGMLSDAQTKFSWQTSDAYNTGYNWGAGVEDSISNTFGGGLGSQYSMDKLAESIGDVPTIGDIANYTGDTADALDTTNENLKYLRDIAEQEAVNRFTTAEVRVEMTNHNSISSNMDLDGVVDYVVTGVQEALERTAEGVHA